MALIEVKSRFEARLWLDEAPPVPRTAGRLVLERSFAISGPARLRSSHLIAIEVFIPLGARFSYGLLGAAFDPGETTLTANAVVTDHPQETWESSLAHPLDLIRIGIPEWATTAILDSISDFDAEQLGGGRLSFNWGAYGEIGSSVSVFARLTKAITQVLTMREPAVETAFQSLLTQVFG